jgi:hypothetical protein
MRFAAALVAMIAVVVALLAPGAALAETVLDYEPTENPVADNVTRLEVNKLRADTHEYVEGAHLVIYPQGEPDNIVAEWVSATSMFELARVLDINTPYVLHEVSAPEGYGLAEDVVFELYSENFNTTGRILSGDANGNAEFEIISGSGPEQAFVINMYDPIKPREEEREIHRQREVERPREETLPKTGDLFNQPLFYGLLAAGVAAVGYGIYMRRKAQ